MCLSVPGYFGVLLRVPAILDASRFDYEVPKIELRLNGAIKVPLYG